MSMANKPKTATELVIEYRPIGSLQPYEKNARTHSEEQVEQICNSIKKFGWTNPILVDGENGIIAGHGRLMAAKRLGLTKLPVIELAGLSDADKRALIIADNKLAMNAGWDMDFLRIELQELADVGFDIPLIGFSADELDEIFGETDGKPDLSPDEAKATLAGKFGIPPFSVLNAREGWWQDRKRAWIALGIQSELGRGENLSSLDGAIDRREAIKAQGGGTRGLTWGNHPAITKKGLNHYRDQKKAKNG